MIVRTLITLSIALTLTACSSPSSLWDDYLNRLERVLDEPIPKEIQIALPAYPEKRQLLQSLGDIRVSVTEAWQLNHCELFKLMGERNSILGKLSEPETQWSYEFRFLQLIPPCISDEQTDEQNKALLEEVYNQKAEGYWQVVWNASFANDDFTHLFSVSTKPLDVETNIDILAFQDSIKQLQNWNNLNNDNPVNAVLDVTKLTSSFALGGAVLQSQRLAIQKLQQSNTMLENATSKRTLCPTGFVSDNLEISRNVLTSVFIQRIQPWLVTVSNAHAASFAASENLIQTFKSNSSALPVTVIVEDYFSEANQLNDLYLRELKTHTQLWQQLFQVCGQDVTS